MKLKNGSTISEGEIPFESPERKYCDSCGTKIDGYRQHETTCGACINLEEKNPEYRKLGDGRYLRITYYDRTFYIQLQATTGSDTFEFKFEDSTVQDNFYTFLQCISEQVTVTKEAKKILDREEG